MIVKVKCNKCGGKARCDYEDSIARGWPRCCGQTMTLLAGQNVAEASKRAVAKAFVPLSGRHNDHLPWLLPTKRCW